MIADLFKNKIEQVKKVLLKIIEMLEANLKKDVENLSKLIRTLNRIESKFQTIENQNINQSIQAKTYASVMKTTTNITKIENEKENTIKKVATANMIATKKKEKIDIANRKRSRKNETSTDNRCRIIEENQKNYKREQKWNDEIEMIFQRKSNAIFNIIVRQKN